MPWTAKEFKDRHNKKMPLAAAGHAAQQAEAMMAQGVSEGVAIATANKYAGKHRKFGAVDKRMKGR